MDSAPMLICYDGSEGARRAIGSAVELFGHRRAVVVNVAPPLTTAEALATIDTITPPFEEQNLDQAAALAEEGAVIAREAGLTAEARGELGAPTWEGVVAAADEIDAAVIVMGSRGLTGARETIEGSLSHQVAEHAGRPVMIVPPARRR
jgi:nucleotide-binding universal stress UspA family protein